MVENSSLTRFLSEVGGDIVDRTPLISDEKFARLTYDWSFAAHGVRRIDYVGRDLLFGSLGRDYRAKLYNDLRRSPPQWVREQAARAQGDDNYFRTLVNHLLFRSIHIRHLLQLTIQEETEGGRLRQQVLSDLNGCRPVGLSFKSKLECHPMNNRPCWLNRSCPWCHCRKVIKLYKRLLAGVCRPETAGHKILIMAKVRVDDVSADGLHPELLIRGRVDRIRKSWKKRLRRFADRLGMSGGLISHQIGPRLDDDGLRSFRHDFSVLGEVDCGIEGDWIQARFDRLKRQAGANDDQLNLPVFDESEGTDSPVPVEVTGMRMGDVKALRWLLAGSPAHRAYCDPTIHNIFRNRVARTHDGSVTVRKNLGVDGALALQPSFLFTADQFWSHLEATRGRHLYSTFGSWVEPNDLASQNSSGSVVDEPFGRRKGIGLLNDVRGLHAEEDRRRLLVGARPVFEELTGILGKSPGRLRFARALEEAGLFVPMRRVSELLDILKS